MTTDTVGAARLPNTAAVGAAARFLSRVDVAELVTEEGSQVHSLPNTAAAAAAARVCLVTRIGGERVGRMLAERLASSDGGLFLDFAGVEYLDYSAADETVGRLLCNLLGGDFGDRYLVLGGLAAGPREVVRRTLELRGLAVLHREQAQGVWECLGAVPEASQPVLAAVLGRDTATAEELAEVLGRAPAAVGARLRRLYRARLISRPDSDKPTRGKRPTYGCVGGLHCERILPSVEPVRKAG